jgi:plastocyanin
MMTRKATLTLLALLLAAALAPAQQPKAHKIAIRELKYDPPKLTIKAGETVEWHNADDNDHTVTSDQKLDRSSKPLFDSDNMSRGESFRHRFDKKGKFPYHCKYHPRMKGVIIVE